jgi:hypothetical protein
MGHKGHEAAQRDAVDMPRGRTTRPLRRMRAIISAAGQPLASIQRSRRRDPTAALDSCGGTDYTRIMLWRFLHSRAGRGQWCLQASDGGGTLAGHSSDQHREKAW